MIVTSTDTRSNGTVVRPCHFAISVMALVFVCILTGAALVRADGCYMPTRAIRRIPTIPAQRAVIVWRAGVETLVISSALDSESQQLGWIIPLPSVPDVIEKESPGALKSLDVCVQPRITHDPVPGLPTVLLWAVIANLLLATALFKRHRFVELLGVLAVLGFFAGLMLPAFSAAGGRRITTRGSSSLQLEKTARVGAYAVTVLRAQSPADLDVWLDDTGFAHLPVASAPAVADYIRKGWVFAAIKFARDEGGTNVPHPIRMTFRSPQAVYPMKLTAVAGGSTVFDLFVIADERVSCRLLDEEFCDRFKADMRNWNADEYEATTNYGGVATGITIGHPTICSLMWSGCVLTKISGTLGSDKMTEDLNFTGTAFGVRQMHLYTWAGATEVAWMLLTGLLGGTLFISMIVCARRIRKPEGGVWYIAYVVLPVALICACCALVFFVAAPKLSASEVTLSRRMYPFHHAHALASAIGIEFTQHPDLAGKTGNQIAECLRTNVAAAIGDWKSPKSGSANPIMGGDLLIEDSPGNFTVEKQATNIAIRVYDFTGHPLHYNFPVGASSQDPARH